MIIQEELSATLDQPTDCLIMHRVEPSRLQMLALNLTDKIQMLAENNEQVLEPRTGRAGYGGTGTWFPGRERQGEKQKGGSGQFQVGNMFSLKIRAILSVFRDQNAINSTACVIERVATCD